MQWTRYAAIAALLTCLFLIGACPDDDASAEGPLGSQTDALDDAQDSSANSDLPSVGDANLDTSLDGLYETVLYQQQKPCGGEFEDREITQQYFRLEAAVIDGIPLLARYECSDATLDSCSDTMSFFQSLGWNGDSWMYYLVGSVYFNGCQLSITRGYPVLTTEGFSIELTKRGNVIDGVQEADCTADIAADVTFEDLECNFLDYFELERIE